MNLEFQAMGKVDIQSSVPGRYIERESKLVQISAVVTQSATT
jgi:hypothetical protein